MRIVLSLALLAIVAASCGNGTSDTTGPAGEDVVLQVLVDGETVSRWTLAELESQVPFDELEIDGDLQTGPRLLDVIAASGITTWESAEVLGYSEGRVLEVGLEIRAAEVDESWIFDVTNRGTLKLAAPALSRQSWVRDVGEIRFR